MSERFYRTVLSTLGIEPSHVADEVLAWDDFAIVAADERRAPTRHLHIAFVAASREHVDEFWRAGLAAGYEDDGRPGERPQYRPDYYGAFLLDADGNSAEAVHHGDTRRGGHIDHLWIRVRDVDAARAFYRAVSRHTGLREGRRWDDGAQFRGAWATFSLVQDGTPATEGLRMSFPAPDRETVECFHGAAIAAGARSQQAPAASGDRRGSFFTASVLDPDGAAVESIFREGIADQVNQV